MGAQGSQLDFLLGTATKRRDEPKPDWRFMHHPYNFEERRQYSKSFHRVTFPHFCFADNEIVAQRTSPYTFPRMMELPLEVRIQIYGKISKRSHAAG